MRRAEIKFSTYRKVPILLAQEGESLVSFGTPTMSWGVLGSSPSQPWKERGLLASAEDNEGKVAGIQ